MTKGKSTRNGHQVAAVPLRRAEDGELEVLLVTSRSTGRWIVPKGWPMRGKADRDAAAAEAHEEAGVTGRMLADAVGNYRYWRRTKRHFRLTRVSVYAMAVTSQDMDWKERGQRTVRWTDLESALHLVEEPELVTLLHDLSQDDRVRKFLSKT